MPFVLSDAGIQVHYVVYRPDASAVLPQLPSSPLSPRSMEFFDSDSEDEEQADPPPGESSLPDVDLSKPTIVILHPPFLDSGAYQWQYNDPQFGGRYNLVGMDIHYHGRTKVEVDDKSWDWDWVCRDIISAIRNIGIKKSHFLCSSWSSHLVAIMYSIAPEMFESLSLVGLVAVDEPEENRFAYQQVRDACFDPQPGDDPTRFPSDVIMGVLWLYFCNNPICHTYVERWNATTPFFPLYRPLMEKVYSALITRPPIPSDALQAVTCPVLAIQGSLDPCCPPAEAEKYVNLLENASPKRLEILDRAPHCLFLTHAADVDRLVIEFLDEMERKKVT